MCGDRSNMSLRQLSYKTECEYMHESGQVDGSDEGDHEDRHQGNDFRHEAQYEHMREDEYLREDGEQLHASTDRSAGMPVIPSTPRRSSCEATAQKRSSSRTRTARCGTDDYRHGAESSKQHDSGVSRVRCGKK